MSEQRWLSTGFLKAALLGKVDADKGIIEGVSVTTEGEALGHEVHLDESFIDTVITEGNAKKEGLKARFGHPNMCSTALGTFIGRFKNFRKEQVTRDNGQKAFRAIADLFMSNSAKDTPKGNLYDYIMKLASTEHDMFGTSVVFDPGRRYRKTKAGKNAYIVYERTDAGKIKCDSSGKKLFAYVDDKGSTVEEKDLSPETFIECAKLHACDAVDDPAANDGLFSKFAKESLAGQLTEFLDLNPQVWKAIETNPEILETLANYGSKVDEFVNRYRAYQEQHTAGGKLAAALNAEPAPAPATAKSDVNAEPLKEPETPKPAESAPGVEKEQKPKEEKSNEPPVNNSAPAGVTVSVAEFKRMKNDFGAEIAAEVYAEGGDYNRAQKLAFDRLKVENGALKQQLEDAGGKPAQFSPTGAKKKARMFESE